MSDYLKSLPLYILPHHLISRVIFHLTRIKLPVCKPFIRWFIRQYQVNMNEALHENVVAYKSFNAFFTRELKPGLRTFTQTHNTLACPVDGRISQIGTIESGRIFQAKNHDYSLLELLGGDRDYCETFEHGRFTTLYLSPKDYHRIHMPYDGVLNKMIYVPGRLFSVAPHTTRTIPRLFARNERVISLFETEHGKLAVILVGAINVAAIETAWHGLVTPGLKRTIISFDYHEQTIKLNKGDELGRFNMGSTVILLTEETLTWEQSLSANDPVKLGMPLGSY